MNTIRKIAVVTTSLVVMLLVDVTLMYVPLVPEAQAILGVRRRTAVVAGATVHAADEAQMAKAQQQTAAAQQQATASQQEAAAAKQEAAAKQQAAAAPPAPPPAAAGNPLPLGTVVAALPAGCTSTPVGGVQYYYCWRELLSRGVSREHPRVCDGPAKIRKRTSQTIPDLRR